MATSSLSPNSLPSAVPPSSTVTPPHQQSSPPPSLPPPTPSPRSPANLTAPPTQPPSTANLTAPPNQTPPTPPPQTPPAANFTIPPTQPPSTANLTTPPSQHPGASNITAPPLQISPAVAALPPLLAPPNDIATSQPQASPPLSVGAPLPQPPPVSSASAPPPQPISSASPPPTASPNPPANPPPIPSANPPASSPPQASPTPPASSSPPPSSSPPLVSPPSPLVPPPIPPPPPTQPPPISLQPPSLQPPKNAPPPPNSPPPSSQPPKNAPPPPSSPPPQITPQPPSSHPPKSAPPPPNLPPLQHSPPSPPPVGSPPPSVVSPPTPPSPPNPSSPPTTRLSPPPSGPSSPSVISLSPPASGNQFTNDSSSGTPSGIGGIGTGGEVAIGLVIGLVLLTVIGLAAWCMRKRKKNVAGVEGGYVMPSALISLPESASDLLRIQTEADDAGSRSAKDIGYSPKDPGGLGNSRSLFAYEELVEATDGFSAQNLLGEGGFGCVYKGCLPDGTEVAVKQLKIGGGQGEREFKSEVEIISRIHHRHLVSLVGYCISESRRLLVYEFVPNNTLSFHLHGVDRPVMDWGKRIKVAAGAARGIAYLNEDCHPRIIHRDIKSSNILLDNNFEARVSDFGLAKLAQDANTHVTTRVMGTFGYMAPEYATSGKLTEKSDVFSFGVVLLELITGRKPVDTSQPLGEESLVEWARPLLNNVIETENFEGLADPRLGNNYVDSEMFRMIEAAAACVRHSATKRPRMGQIVRAFDSMATEDLTNGMRVGESEIFNSAQQSAEIRLFNRMAFGSQNYSTDFFTQGNWSNSSGNKVNTDQ